MQAPGQLQTAELLPKGEGLLRTRIFRELTAMAIRKRGSIPGRVPPPQQEHTPDRQQKAQQLRGL